MQFRSQLFCFANHRVLLHQFQSRFSSNSKKTKQYVHNLDKSTRQLGLAENSKDIIAYLLCSTVPLSTSEVKVLSFEVEILFTEIPFSTFEVPFLSSEIALRQLLYGFKIPSGIAWTQEHEKTKIYTHVSQKNLQKIISPFDDL